MCIFHKYGKWGYPVQTYTGHKQQYRRCEKCGKVSFRTWWDKQSSLTEVIKSIQMVEKDEVL